MGNSRVFFPFGLLTLFVLIITGIVCFFWDGDGVGGAEHKHKQFVVCVVRE